MKKLNCPVCNKELLRLEPFEEGVFEFWCDDCNIDITITKNDEVDSIDKKEAKEECPMSKIIDGKKIAVKIPEGYIVAEEKGTENEYPGVYISFSTDKNTNLENLIACTEYDSCNEAIITGSYAEGQEECIALIRYYDGEDLMY